MAHHIGDAQLKVHICANVSQVALKAARIIRTQINQHPQTILGLATGNTQMALYKLLIEEHQRHRISFSRVSTFNLDEYCGLAEDSSRSFRYFMQENFFKHVDINESCIHFPSCTASNPLEYEERISAAGTIDLQMLGIGVNGHIAFNEPGSDFLSRTRTIRLTKSTLDENFPGHASNQHELIPRRAITMGIGTILEAKKIVIVATGRQKAAAVQQALEGPITVKCPASALRTHHDVTVLIDNAAASKLCTTTLGAGSANRCAKPNEN